MTKTGNQAGKRWTNDTYDDFCAIYDFVSDQFLEACKQYHKKKKEAAPYEQQKEASTTTVTTTATATATTTATTTASTTATAPCISNTIMPSHPENDDDEDNGQDDDDYDNEIAFLSTLSEDQIRKRLRANWDNWRILLESEGATDLDDDDLDPIFFTSRQDFARQKSKVLEESRLLSAIRKVRRT